MASKHFPGFTKQFFNYRGSLRRHGLCICNLIVLIANQIPLQKFGSLMGTQLVVSNIRPFSRVHSRRARCEESVLSGQSVALVPSRSEACDRAQLRCDWNLSLTSRKIVTLNNFDKQRRESLGTRLNMTDTKNGCEGDYFVPRQSQKAEAKREKYDGNDKF